VTRKLTRDQAAAMTVNERLFEAGLLAEFDRALAARDAVDLRRILAEVFVPEADIERIVASALERG
jgi:hypothetical protein